MPERRTGRALFIIGMHRSGTSALTRTLSLCGAALPTDLMPDGPYNPGGHWEPRPIADLNDKIFRTLGTHWHTPFPLERNQATAATLDSFRDIARDMLRQQFREQPLIVFKEPRATVLADFWCAILRDLDYAPQVIVMVRDPGEITASLARRDGFPHNHGLLLWASYMVQAEMLTRGERRLFCSYDELLAAPHMLLERIEEELGPELPLRTEARDGIDAFLREDLRHHRLAGEMPEEAALAPFQHLASWLDARVASRPLTEDVPAATASWLEALRPIFGPIIAENNIALSAERIRSRRRIAQDGRFQEMLAGIRSALSDRDALIEMMQQDLMNNSAGFVEVRDPMSGQARPFDPARYLALHPDVDHSGMDPWDHFNQVGQYEGRSL